MGQVQWKTFRHNGIGRLWNIFTIWAWVLVTLICSWRWSPSEASSFVVWWRWCEEFRCLVDIRIGLLTVSFGLQSLGTCFIAWQDIALEAWKGSCQWNTTFFLWTTYVATTFHPAYTFVIWVVRRGTHSFQMVAFNFASLGGLDVDSKKMNSVWEEF